MTVHIPYGKHTFACELSDAAVLTSHVDQLRSPQSGLEIVRRAMAAPIDSPHLEELARGKRTCTIIISDHTRPVPSRDILPPMLEELRAVKTPSEIEIMKECSRITTDIYDALFKRIHVGLSEIDVAKIMMEECEKRNVCTAFGNPPEYPLVLNPKGGMSHRGPNDSNICEPGDMLVIDFSIRYNGYTSDIARTMYFLKPGEEHAPQDAVDCANAAIRAVGAVMEKIKPGMKGYEVDEIGRQSIIDSGFPPFPHSTGHQVGLEVHDGGTTLGPKTGRYASHGVLRKNEIYALEPTVLQDRDKRSAIIEDNVLLTDDGCVLISKRQTALIEIPYRTGEEN